MAKTIYTLGHSNRPIEEFLSILEKYKIKQLVDIRSLPGSTKNPQFNSEALEKSVNSKGIDYVYIKDLGGLRKKNKDSTNLGWHNLSFRNYADYMQTKEFTIGIDHLTNIATKKLSCIMCAEAVPWRCHRSMVADALLARKWIVIDIFSQTHFQYHQMTSFAKVDGLEITYPHD